MTVLGIETSCDETSAALLVDGDVRSNIVSSQMVHQRYGGVVPELASRAHLRLIVPVVEEALRAGGAAKTGLDRVAVTFGPGLVGSLLVGLNFAKGFAYGLRIPLVGVNHIEGHVYAGFTGGDRPRFPFISLVVSGGHTQIILVRRPFDHALLGETIDDAAGEAYDKVAKMAGLGFPGGPAIDRLAASGDPAFAAFPRSSLGPDSFDFSFSGVKTAVLYWLRDRGLLAAEGRPSPLQGRMLADVCASFQAAVVDVLTEKTVRAAEKYGVGDIAVGGGVSANSALRSRLGVMCRERGIRLCIPPPEYCTDNAAMIAMAAWMKGGDAAEGFGLKATANAAL